MLDNGVGCEEEGFQKGVNGGLDSGDAHTVINVMAKRKLARELYGVLPRKEPSGGLLFRLMLSVGGIELIRVSVEVWGLSEAVERI